MKNQPEHALGLDVFELIIQRPIIKCWIFWGSPSEGTTRGKLNHIHQYSQYFEDIFLENKVKQRIKSIYLYILKYLLRLFTKKWTFLHKKSNFIFSNENVRLFYFKLRGTLYKQYLERSDCPWSFLRWYYPYKHENIDISIIGEVSSYFFVINLQLKWWFTNQVGVLKGTYPILITFRKIT